MNLFCWRGIIAGALVFGRLPADVFNSGALAFPCSLSYPVDGADGKFLDENLWYDGRSEVGVL